MADFTGTAADEIITPDFVSPTVTATGGAHPSNAADTINAGGGNDVIESGGGNDVVTGGPGSDTAILGSGNDTFIWNPGDGSDLVEGGKGTDTLVFNGANINEIMTLSANGSRTRLTRDVGSVVMDLNSVENIDINARGGADNITVDDLSGTGVKRVAIDLAGTPGSGVGDGAADIVTVNGTAGDDHITVSTSGSSGVVNGLAARVTVTGAEASDRLVVNGLGGNDTLTFDVVRGGGDVTLFADGTAVAINQADSTVVVDAQGIENLVINGSSGDDVIRASNGIAALTNLTINGGAGNDTIFGGDGADVINAGDGNDSVVGGRGNDTALLGSGNDTFIWNPGDGSDVVEGQGGFDTMLFNGANVAEHVTISANGSRVRFFRDVAGITMDLDSMERIEFNALGGTDTITVDDLAGTDTRQVAIDLSAPAGSGTGDGAADTVVVNGTAGDDHIVVSTSGDSATVTGLATQVLLTGAETIDRLVIDGLGGNDTVTFTAASGGEIDVFLDGTHVGVNQVGSTVVTDLANVENLVINGTSGEDVIRGSNGIAGLTSLTINGGAGNDTIFGGDGADLINGGDGNDFVVGGRGNDTALLGSGDDTFVWNPGDGSDLVEGQSGFDTLLFNGANVAEHVSISANGSRVRFFRDVAGITMDLNGIERIDFNALGGADTITVDDLSGTSTKQVAIDLSAPSGSGVGDGAADTVVVNGSAGNDHIKVASNGASVVVSGLAADVTINGAEGANDTLVINALDGNDRIDASALQAGQINLVLNGGTGNDTLIGSAGNDMLSGGLGADTFVFAGGFGHDTVGDFLAGSGNGGHDFVQFDRSIFSNFADVLQHAQQIGNDTTITVDPNRSITLQNVALNSLTASDFRFA